MTKRIWTAKSVGLLLWFVTMIGAAALGAWRLTNSSRPSATDAALARGDDSVGLGLYVDEAVCVKCHSAEVKAHARSGHADTFRLGHKSPLAERLAKHIFADPERQVTYQYNLDDEVLTVSIPARFGPDRFPLSYALGSGHNAVTFLTLVPDRLGDTVGIEHRISVYHGANGWDLDLTPGHLGQLASQEVEQFGKIIRGDKLQKCISCHTTTAEIKAGRVTGLRPNVGCQSCHGPGREHIVAMQAGRDAASYSLRKMTAEQQVNLCGQCHRLPPDDSSEKPSPDNLHNVRFQPVGLLQSRCHTASGGLKCTTCHDPHQPVSRDQADYEQRCLSCHGKAPARNCKVSPQRDCVSCHMPAVDIHRGTKFHDHWIRIHPDKSP